MPDILINEVNVEVNGGAENGGEFIELTDKGWGMTPLDGFLLVLFNGANQDRSYWEADLSGYRSVRLSGISFFCSKGSVTQIMPEP